MHNEISSPPAKEYTVSIELILAIIALFMAIRYCLDYPIDQDVMMMTRIGDELLKTKSFPPYDPFSWPPVSCKVPWINIGWLSFVIYSLIHGISGFAGIVLLKTILYTSGYLIMAKYASEKYGLRAALLALIVALYLGRWFLSARPMIWSALIFPLIILLLFRLQNRDISLRDFIIFPLIYALWVNLHGGFLIGLIIMGMCGVILLIRKIRARLERKKILSFIIRYSALVALCLAMCLYVNPFGPKTMKYAMDFLLYRPVFAELSREMESPFLRPLFNLHYFLITGLSLILLLLIIVKKKSRPSLMEICIFGFWLYTSIKAVRNMQLYSVFFIPVGAFILCHLGEIIRMSIPEDFLNKFLLRYRKSWDVVKVLLLFLVLTISIMAISSSDLTGVTSERMLYPVGAKDFLKANSLPPNLYCYDIYGSYLSSYLYPRYLVGMDGRWNGVYNDSYFIEMNNSLCKRDLLLKFLDKYSLDTVVLQNNLDYLKDDRNWPQVYVDEKCSIFLRNTPRNSELMEKFKTDRLVYPDTYEVNAWLYLHFLEEKNYGAAKRHLMSMIRVMPDEKTLWEHLRALDSLLDREKQPGRNL